MSIWRQLKHGWRGLTRRGHVDQDVSDEIAHYLERSTAALIAQGLSPEAAERAARLELGNTTVVHEQVRGYGWEQVVSTWLADVRFAARQLRRSPAFTVLAVFTLALGIGATTAIFSAVNPILFESLPYPDANRIAMIWDVGADGSNQEGTFATYSELAERNKTFTAIAVMKPWRPTMTGPDQPERFEGQRVSASYFRVLGVSPIAGKAFEEADDRQNGARVVVLSDAIWRRRFAADPAIVGRQVTLDDNSYTVVGVMPQGFENVVASSAELWAPLQYDMSEGRAWGHHLRTIGRLKPNVTVEAARQDINVIARSLIVKHPQAFGHPALAVRPLQEDVTQAVKPALMAVSGAVVLLLLIACVNVTNLLLARATQRRGEFAVRAALGAGRKRVARQLLTESLLLAALGSAGGLLIARLGVRSLVALTPPNLPRLSAISIDASVFAFALGVTVVVGIAFGLVPALQASRTDLQKGLQLGSKRSAGGHHVTRRTLVVAEVALALVLLLTSGLLLRSMQRLFAVDAGFVSSNLLTMRVQTSGQRFATDSSTYQFFDRSLDAVRRVPGVVSAAFTSTLPLSGDADTYGAQFEQDNDPASDHSVFRYAVSPGYFQTMQIQLRRGRLLDERDTRGAPPAVVINESLAKRKFPGQDPTGRHVHIGPTDRPWYTIVGVVSDVKQLSLTVDHADAAYVTPSQWHFADNEMSLVVRTQGNPSSLTPLIRNAIWSVDKDQPITRVATMDALVAASASERRFAMVLFTAFALVALVLAAAGIYGVLSGSVAERTREIGVRSALGASHGEILGLIAKQGMSLTAIGGIIGLAGAAAATQGISSLMFGISRLDPATYIGVIVVLGAVSAIACAVPAWRAARVDPAITLRSE